jgi:hypothetical protein
MLAAKGMRARIRMEGNIISGQQIIATGCHAGGPDDSCKPPIAVNPDRQD